MPEKQAIQKPVTHGYICWELMDDASVAALLIQDETIAYANKACTRLLGYSPSELIGSRLLVAVAPECAEQVLENINAITHGCGTPVKEFEAVRKDGSSFHAMACGFPVNIDGKLSTILLFTDLSENDRVRNDLISANKRLHVIQEVSRLILSELDLRQVAKLICEKTMELTGSQIAAFAIYDPKQNMLSHLYRIGNPEGYEQYDFPADAGLIGKAFTSGKVICANDVLNEPGILQDVVLNLGIKALIHAPINVGGKAKGVFTVCKREGAFSNEDLEIVTAIAEQSAIAVQNASLYSELQEAREHDKLLSEMLLSIKTSLDPNEAIQYTVDHVAKVMGAHRCAFGSHRGDHFVLTHQWTAEGILKADAPKYEWKDFGAALELLSSGKQFVVDSAEKQENPQIRDVMERMGSTAGIASPIFVNGEFIGFIVVDQFFYPRVWKETEKKLIANIADHLAVALGNARLIRELSSSHDREHLLNELLMQIKTTLEVGPLIKSTVQKLGQILEVSRCFFMRNLGNNWRVEEKWAVDEFEIYPIIRQEWTAFQEYLKILQQNQPIVLNDIESEALPELAELIEKAQLKSAMVVPVFSGENFVGAIGLNQCDKPRRWSTQEIVFVQSVASHLGLAIRNAELYLELKRKNQVLTRQKRELNELAAQLERANKIKTDFLTKTSHELRTPLNAAMGFLELVLNGVARGPEEQQLYLSNAYKSCQDLLGLINDLLDIGRIEAGKLELELTSFNLHELFHEVKVTIEVEAQNKGLDLDFSVPEGIKIFADFRRMKQILLNVLSNAVKFTNQGGISVSVTTDQSAQKAVITVRDTGIGIAPEKQKELFSEFYQAEMPTSQYAGAGLGLAISKSLIELMAGEIAIHSEGRNKGTTVIITVPLASQDARR